MPENEILVIESSRDADKKKIFDSICFESYFEEVSSIIKLR